MRLRRKVLAGFLLGVVCIFIFFHWIQNNDSVTKSIRLSSVILNDESLKMTTPQIDHSIPESLKTTVFLASNHDTTFSSINHDHPTLPFLSNSPKRKKLILSWTTFFGVLMDDKYFNTCPEMRHICELTVDRDRFVEADATVFHAPDVNWSQLPLNRTKNQVYVFLLQEPPTKTWFKVDVKANFYNWTMTYRMDSDIPHPYYHLAPDTNASQVLDVSIVNKTGDVVWFVSNCNSASQRERYVEQLKKYISLDIYGLCGWRNCSKVEDPPGISVVAPCEKDLIDRVYKFYIAFENSVCKDYITEKFFHRRNFNSVPIVLSRSIVQDLLPPKSFIAASDFPKGPKELADYLKYLMENPREYMQYFEWKKVGYSPSKAHPITGMQWGFCGLCEKLWRSGTEESKVYEWINEWWGSKVSCDADFVRHLIG